MAHTKITWFSSLFFRFKSRFFFLENSQKRERRAINSPRKGTKWYKRLTRLIYPTTNGWLMQSKNDRKRSQNWAEQTKWTNYTRGIAHRSRNTRHRLKMDCTEIEYFFSSSLSLRFTLPQSHYTAHTSSTFLVFFWIFLLLLHSCFHFDFKNEWFDCWRENINAGGILYISIYCYSVRYSKEYLLYK